MGVILFQEKERKKKLFWSASKYYDYPDGQDLIGKLKFTNKIAGLVGSFFGLAYATNFRPVPTTYREKTLRYFQVLLPSLGMATIFTCVTYFSTNIRKKDDAVNYIIGGLAAGAVLIPVSGKINVGVAAIILISGMGGLKKYLKMQNKNLIPSPAFRQKSSYYERCLNTSLEPDTRRGNWTK